MLRKQVLEHVRALDLQHARDYDGGYELVRSVREWAQSLDPNSLQLLWDVLLNLVERQDPMWNVALDTLVEERQVQVAEKLSNLLNDRGRSVEFKDQIILALLRLKYGPSAELATNYLNSALLVEGRDEVLPSVAALCRLDAEHCLNLSSKYFARTLRSQDSGEEHRGYIQSFVLYFLDADENLFQKLVERTKTINPAASRRLAVLIDEELNRSFNIRKYGLGRLNRVRSEVCNSS